jgi:hypothetical protein
MIGDHSLDVFCRGNIFELLFRRKVGIISSADFPEEVTNLTPEIIELFLENFVLPSRLRETLSIVLSEACLRVAIRNDLCELGRKLGSFCLESFVLYPLLRKNGSL